MISDNRELHPQDGHTLQVIRIARISTLSQDERSLDDQLALLKKHVEAMYDGPVEYYDIATQGSGERLDREELALLEALIEARNHDLAITEDLARICRRTRAIDFCELCEDCGMRLIAINDRVDTADGGWRDGAFISSWHHERSNRDTIERIQRSLRNRFVNGAILSDPGPFYVVPDGADNISQIQKAPGAEEIVERGFSMLEAGSGYSEVADWLNEIGFPVGGQSKQKKWDCRLVTTRFLHPRLKGIDEWNNHKSVRHNKSGNRRSVPAPESELLTRECPHLAFVDADRFDRLQRQLVERNAHYRRSESKESDPLKGRPKKRTPFPGQMVFCGVCDHKFVFGGHGQTEHLMCDGARAYSCWNGISIDGPLVAKKIADAVFQEVENMPGFDEAFLNLVNEEALAADSDRQQQLQQLRKKAQQCERTIDNYISFIEEGDSSERIRERLRQAEEEFEDVNYEIRQLEAASTGIIEIPTIDELKTLARETLQQDLPFTWEFNKVMQRLVPKIVVFPYRLIDGGHIVMRARFRLHLGELLPDACSREALRAPMEKVLEVDLFEPPQREEFRKEVVRLRGEGLTERNVAKSLEITITATQRASQLQRLMDARGITGPYIPVLEPPHDYNKLRRQLHARYQFAPLDGAGEF